MRVLSSLCSFFFLLNCFSWAASAQQTQNFPLKDIQKIKFKFPQAQIKMFASTNPQLELSGADLDQLKVSKEDETLIVEPRENQKDKKWNLKITASLLPLEFFMSQGSLELRDWKNKALVHLQKGDLQVFGSLGDFQVHMIKGKTSFLNHTGDLNLDFYNVDLEIKGLEGNLQVANFSGETILQKLKGSVKWNSLSGPLKVAQSQGNLQLETQKGSISASEFQGRIEGLNQEGSTQVSLIDTTDMNFRSLSGAIRIQASDKSSQWVNLSTVSGELWAPSYLKESRDGSGKNIQGRLRGLEPKGVLRIRSADGSISLK